MSGSAISVHSLSKRYHIGAARRGRTLREAVMDAAAEPFRRLRRFGRSSAREEDAIWALHDVSFEVEPGEVLGVIGRNGAGKSTLLKILSRITWPTEGRAELSGRVASLLEVGTGFHSELTGRENVYLSGAILGMRKAEIDARFDEIVAFSGVEKFIDTPVKRYSSGMRVRLGFAVAAHLDPEIMLIDEVLSVGDVAFQKKCLGKMEDVSRGGRTVLFVSHNMASVRHLCTRCLALADGQVLAAGGVDETVDAYLASMSEQAEEETPAEPAAWVTKVEFIDEEGRPASELRTGGPARARLHFRCREDGACLSVRFSIWTPHGVPLFTTAMLGEGPFQVRCSKGDHRAEVRIAALPFSAGRYAVGAGIWMLGDRRVHLVEHGGEFEILPSDVYGSGRPPRSGRTLVVTEHEWQVEEDDPGLEVVS
jgi:lipopolysaccharide transport system ATP-binding protein